MTQHESPEVDRYRKGRRDSPPPPKPSDFPRGKLIVAQHQEYNGVLAHFLCQVVECYSSRLMSRHDDLKLCLIARIADVTLERDVDLIGHLTPIRLSSSSWPYNEPRLSQMKPDDFENAKEPKRRA